MEDKNTDNRDVTITDYRINREVDHVTKTTVMVQNDGEVIEYAYPAPVQPDSFTLHVVKRNLSNDSILIYYDDTARLVNNKIYVVDGKSWEIKKYFSDAGGIADGEYLLYMNNDLGLIAIQDQSWGNFGLFDYENGKISQQLKSDSLDFFNAFKDVPFD